MAQSTFEALSPHLRDGIAEGGSRPWGFLYSADELSQARQRAGAHPELVQKILAAAERTFSGPDLLTIVTEPYYSLGKLEQLVEAQMLQPQARYERGILDLLRAFAQHPQWVSHVHKSRVDPKLLMKCDHCAANTAAAIALAVEALGPSLPADEEESITRGVYERALRPFLECCEERSEFWARRDYRFNWRIMTCGDAGLAALNLSRLPDRDRMVAFALEGVADVLDHVPSEGDWEEGVGYWSATLYFGLRFARALRRATAGRVDLFQHPGLVATSQYFTHVTLPDGSIFNYADNSPTIRPTPLYLLARETRVGHLAWTARRMGHQGFWDLLFDDPSLPSEQPSDQPRARVFSTTGIAMARSDWSDQAFYVGFKSGPTKVGHSQLDVQSFIVSKGNAPLVTDPGYWTQAHFLGSFGARRWDFDGNSTIGHNAVLVDGRGQTYGAAGQFIAAHTSERLAYFVSDAVALYPDLLERCDRWLAFAPPDVLLIYDDLASGTPRYWEWLLHPAGVFSSGRASHLIENRGVQLSLTRLLPAEDTPWRNTEETRTSYYHGSDALMDVEHTIRLCRFGPMFPSQEIEFLWAMHLGASEDIRWRLERGSSSAFVVHGEGSDRRVSLSFDRPSHTCRLALT